VKPRDHIFPLIFIPLGLAFVTICILLWFKGDDNKRLIHAKMSIGALLLSFSFFTACTNGPAPIKTCYKPAVPNTISIDTYDNIVAGDTLKGRIFISTYQIISYEITDSAGNQILQKGIFPDIDTTQTRTFSECEIIIDPSVKAGQYMIGFYGRNEVSEKPVLISRQTIEIIEKK
jgi:hypothetical protein